MLLSLSYADPSSRGVLRRRHQSCRISNRVGHLGDVGKALPLSCEDYPTWEVEVPASSDPFEYKFFRAAAMTGEITWEGFEGNRILPPGTGSVDAVFGLMGTNKGMLTPTSVEESCARAATQFSSSTGSTCSSEGTSVSFRVTKHTVWGDSMKLVGSSPQLGAWNVQLAPAMTCDAYPSWHLELDLGVNPNVEFKFVYITKNGSVVWETGENRRLQFEDGGSSCAVIGVFSQ
eukprot:TRINITY_DN65391_c0_g1_i1.p1 TRINITY_DN65391_c0_g1~~TRINITY_DN65391_c0_g1_i1.p1  ORF type:complete len:232 (-),score=19.01 TRINITY_DN65391_c0_g1_i1:20-715(-)